MRLCAMLILGALLAAGVLMAYRLGAFGPVPEEALPLDGNNPGEACVALCEEKLAAGVNLSNGSCLSNNIIPNWVCDVAHSPRTSSDNNPANQCLEYGRSANHFVEVTPECELIRAS